MPCRTCWARTSTFVCSTPGAVRTLITAIYGNAVTWPDTSFKGVEDGTTDADAPIIRLVTTR